MPQQPAMPASVLSPNRQSQPKSRQNSSPSPSYFGLNLDSRSGSAQSSANRVIKTTSTPSAISIRSVAASPPQNHPYQSNSEFDAFRRQVDSNAFSLNQDYVPQLQNRRNHDSPESSPDKRSSGEPSTPKFKHEPSGQNSAHKPHMDGSPVSRSINKRGLSSADIHATVDRPHRGSCGLSSEGTDASREAGSPPAKNEKYPRLSLPHEEPSIPLPISTQRSETLPEKLDPEDPTMITPQRVVNMLDSHGEEALLLDLRVSTQYAQSCISGALNLCVPTTLLKRPSYSAQRLCDTFHDANQRKKFENWRACKCIIVYDSSSSQLKEAASCLNILKKFRSEGWDGASHIIRGGFSEFSRKFPAYIEQKIRESKGHKPLSLKLNTDEETIAPVVGGCPIPEHDQAANPFFGNIRQNMDLIGGVGQMQVKIPASASSQQQRQLPMWLREVADEGDKGKAASEKFLQIEKREQKRMQEALSGNVVYNSARQGYSKDSPKTVQIAGIEQGSKNRYNNIWPFEHSRVKLRDVPTHGCDYINANFVQTSLSSKKYIATQGPIPATFTDFWNMVWQRDIRVIVMLTAETEGGQVKAHNYWNQRMYGPLKVNFVSEHRASIEPDKIQQRRQRPSLGKHRASYPSSASSNSNQSRQTLSPGQPLKTPQPSSASKEQPYVHVRKFMVSHEDKPFERVREITHLQYSSWPDFGAPAHPKHLLGLVEQCNAVVDNINSPTVEVGYERPVLVHCSAGCGRTGTFCTVDTVLDILKKQQSLASKRYHRHSSPRPAQRNAYMREPSPMDIDSDSYTSTASSFHKESYTDNNQNLAYRDDIDYVEKTVEEFRLQRLSMVQSLRQFVLCYETVLEWIIGQGHS